MTAAARFLSSDPAGIELPWQSVEAVLDALEDGRLAADDYLFDAVRQAWQPIRKHDEVVAAWDRRMGYRPPERRRLLGSAVRRPVGFPALDSDGITPVSSPAVARPLRRPHTIEDPETPAARRWGALVGAALVVGFIAAMLWGFVRIGRGVLALVGG